MSVKHINDELVQAAYESALDDRLINPRLVIPIIDRMRAAENERDGYSSSINGLSESIAVKDALLEKMAEAMVGDDSFYAAMKLTCQRNIMTNCLCYECRNERRRAALTAYEAQKEQAK